MNILWELFASFLKIGFFGFGGGYAMLSLIFEDSVKMGLTVQQFADMNALDMIIPGPIAINAATYVGYLLGGFSGTVIATIAISIPSFIFVYLLGLFENAMNENRMVIAFMRGVKAAAVGVIASAVYFLFKDIVFENGVFSIFAFLVFVVGFVFQYKYKANSIVITLLAGVCGYLLYYLI